MWVYIRCKGYKPEDLTSSYMHGYHCVVHKHQYWRLVVSQFSHIHLGHLLMNMAVLLIAGFAEGAGGSFHHLRWLLIMLVGTAAIETLTCHLLVKLGRAEGIKDRVSVLGCTGMVAGMIIPPVTIWTLVPDKLATAIQKMGYPPRVADAAFSTEFWTILACVLMVQTVIAVLMNMYFGASMIGLMAGWAIAQVGALTGEFAWVGPYSTACLGASVVALVLYGLWEERAMLAYRSTEPEYQSLTLSKETCLVEL
jgi:membrane associated rhomboid family serine protease